MAYGDTGSTLSLLAHANGFGYYRYDSLDDVDLVEDAGYFNNKDDDLNLQIGDVILAFDWTTAVGTKGQNEDATAGTLNAVKQFVVTNVVANDAAASAGAVNVAEIGVSSAGAISSGD